MMARPRFVIINQWWGVLSSAIWSLFKVLFFLFFSSSSFLTVHSSIHEEGAGISWVIALAETTRAHVGHGSELSFEVGAKIDIVKLNASPWWRGLNAQTGIAGLFHCESVKLTKVYSSHLETLLGKLGNHLCQDSPPTAKIKLLMGAAVFDRGTDDFSAIQQKLWLDCRPNGMPPLYPSTCCLRWVGDDVGSELVQVVKFTCPASERGDASVKVHAMVQRPKLGPNLVNKVRCSLLLLLSLFFLKLMVCFAD